MAITVNIDFFVGGGTLTAEIIADLLADDPQPDTFASIHVTGAALFDTILTGAGITATFAAPPAIGGTTPAAAAFTTLSASGAVSGAGIAALFTAPSAIGGVTPAAGSFTTLGSTGLATLSSIKSDTGTKTASATGGAATLAKTAGVITTEALTTIAGASYTLTLSNTTIAAADQVFASVSLGSATTGIPVVATVTPGSNQVVIVIENNDLAAAFNGTLKIAFMVLKN